MVWSIPYMSTRLIFFFSSRRRHTRYWRDWSSDVCSSDLQLQLAVFHRGPDILADLVKDLADFLDGAGAEGDADIVDAAGGMQVEIEIGENGKASGRGRGVISGVAVLLQKKTEDHEALSVS